MDLPDLRDDDFADLRQSVAAPVVPAVAIRGEGVVETLHAVLQLCYRNLDRTFGLAGRWNISEKEFLDSVFHHVDVKGTRLQETGSVA